MDPLQGALVVGFVALAITWIISIPFGEVSRFKLLRRLRQQCPDVWSSLGEPTFWWNASPKNHIATLRWIVRAEYRDVSDPVVGTLASRVRFSTFIQLGVPLLFIAASAIEAIVERIAG